jgi:hypothetical protein
MAKKIEPVEILPFRIHNLGDFIQQNHPMYDPESDEYDEYWASFTEKCILGMWGHDYDAKNDLGGWRFLPGNMFFYVNGTIIKMQDVGKPEITSPPKLRDVEWYMGYNLNVCDGFAGFTEDDQYTGFWPVYKLEKDIPLSETDRILMDVYAEKVRNRKGELKKFLHPRDILYKTYDEPMGDAMYINQKLNMILLTTRGTGKSFGINGMFTTHRFVFNGARTVEDFLQQQTSSTVVVSSYDSKKSEDMLKKFSANWSHIKNSLGAYDYGGGDNANGAFFFPTAGSLDLSNVFTKTIKSKSGQGTEGVATQIAHVSYFNNPSAAVGHRGDIVVEEAGLMKNFTRAHGENEAVQKRDTKAFFTVYLGTGGDVQAIREIQSAFYNPDRYDVLSFPDAFSGGARPIGQFIPAYYANNLFKDENGNTDIKKAFDDQMYERDRRRGTDAYSTYCISYPIVPKEMFRSAESSYFPTALAEDRLAYLEENDARKSFSIGNLEYVGRSKESVLWREDLDRRLKPIIRLGDEDVVEDKSGAFVIFEHPVSELPERRVDTPQYITLYDPVHKDGDGSSLVYSCTFKFWDFNNPNRKQMTIVAEWVGREKTLDMNHERVFKQAAYYNSMILFEESITDFKRYATQTNRYHWLQPRPGVVLDGLIKDSKAYDVGVQVVPGMKRYLIQYLAELLDTTAFVEEYIKGNEFVRTERKVVELLDSFRALDEILFYNEDDNFDCISALFLLGLWVKDQVLKPVDYGGDSSVRRAEDAFREEMLNRVGKIAPIKHTAFTY